MLCIWFLALVGIFIYMLACMYGPLKKTFAREIWEVLMISFVLILIDNYTMLAIFIVTWLLYNCYYYANRYYYRKRKEKSRN